MVRHIRLKAVSIIVPTISLRPSGIIGDILEIWEQTPRLFRILQAVITVRSISGVGIGSGLINGNLEDAMNEYLPHWAIFSRMQPLPLYV